MASPDDDELPTEVKIEIDVAEDPYWMIQDHCSSQDPTPHWSESNTTDTHHETDTQTSLAGNIKYEPVTESDTCQWIKNVTSDVLQQFQSEPVDKSERNGTTGGFEQSQFTSSEIKYEPFTYIEPNSYTTTETAVLFSNKNVKVEDCIKTEPEEAVKIERSDIYSHDQTEAVTDIKETVSGDAVRSESISATSMNEDQDESLGEKQAEEDTLNRSSFPLTSFSSRFYKAKDANNSKKTRNNFKMADQKQASTRRPVFKRYTALEVLDEIMNDRDSGDEDFQGQYSEFSDEDESDSNQHHPLLSEVVDDNEGDPDFETADASESEEDIDSEPALEPPELILSTSSSPSPVIRDCGRGRRKGRGSGVRQPRGRSSGCGVQSELIRGWQDADAQAPNQDIDFEGEPGVKFDDSNFSPVKYMELFFDDDLINHLVIQTNLYAHQFKESHPNLPQFSRAHQWEKVDNTEMKRFLALMLLMGIVKLPSIELYWSKKVLYRIPVFSSVMTRNRFQAILQFLHFHDNSTMPAPNDPQYDRLYKIRPVLDHLHQKFQEVYEPRQAVCVDESLLLWKGRLIFRQHILLKHARFGIKLGLCCESDGGKKESGGYCYRFKVYAGKEYPVNEIRPVLEAANAHNPNLSTRENMVLFLVAPLLNKGYHVYTDNWYSSLRLFLFLLEKKTLACGTVHENRGIPHQLHDVSLNPGSSAAMCGDGKVVATKYHNTKVVHLLSTAHGHSESAIADRRRRCVTKRPLVSTNYNKNMGGVDKQDQLLQPYDCTRKSMKWTKKIFFHFFQVAACNAFILSKSGENPSKSFLAFLESLICGWLWPDCVPAVVKDQKDDEVRLTGRHFIFPIPATPNKVTPQRPCRVCTKKLKIRRDVRFHCPFCPSKPALCYPQCFMDYHTKFVYWQ